jgi:hypothetical protein
MGWPYNLNKKIAERIVGQYERLMAEEKTLCRSLYFTTGIVPKIYPICGKQLYTSVDPTEREFVGQSSFCVVLMPAILNTAI